MTKEIPQLNEMVGLQQVALEVRRLFETGEVYTDSLTELYQSYSSDLINIEAFMVTAKRIFPKGNCGLTSLFLHDRLGAGEVTRGYYGKNSHTFLILNKTVVDITADQFGGPPIYVGNLVAPWRIK